MRCLPAKYFSHINSCVEINLIFNIRFYAAGNFQFLFTDSTQYL